MQEAETPVGPHTFNKNNTKPQENNVRESRETFIGHCLDTNCKIMNTFFEKPDEKLMTHRENFTNREPPYIRGNYETLDYIIVPERWKNTVINVESDKDANIKSDHMVLKATIKIKLKALNKQTAKMRNKFGICTEQTRYEYNKKLKEEQGKERKEWITDATEEIIPKIKTNNKKKEISEELTDLIEDRGKALLEGNIEEAKRLNKEIVKQRKRERKIEVLESVRNELDLRTKWLGIRNMKKIPANAIQPENRRERNQTVSQKKRQSRNCCKIPSGKILEENGRRRIQKRKNYK